MIRINENFLKLQASYLFSDIAKRISAYQKANPDKSIIKLGIGDVTEPLPQACLDAFHSAIDEMGTREGFHGYGPEQGYSFLREAIAENDFQARGADISADEIFVSDGAKCDQATDRQQCKRWLKSKCWKESPRTHDHGEHLNNANQPISGNWTPGLQSGAGLHHGFSN